MLKFQRKILSICFFIFIACFISACGSLKSSSSSANLSITSAQYLNPNVYGKAAPVVVNIYQLKVPYAFMQASYSQLSENAAKTLGADLVDKTTIEVRPGSQMSLHQALTPNSHYIGITADYRNIDQAKWRTMLKVNNAKGQNNPLDINLASQTLTAKVGSGSNSFWSALS